MTGALLVVPLLSTPIWMAINEFSTELMMNPVVTMLDAHMNPENNRPHSKKDQEE